MKLKPLGAGVISLLDSWADKNVGTKAYSAGTWGPSKADMLMEKDQRSWYEA